MKRLLYLPVALIAYWAVAQNAPAPLAGIFPSGAMLYLESKDFGAMLRDWDASPEKSDWLKSPNYEAFSRSRLFLRLGDAQKEFAAAAGVPPDYAMLSAVAGTNSALGMYHIGNLEFLYATHLASARALSTALWKARGTYQTRRAGGVDYFVKEDTSTHRLAAFAYAGDLLLLATKESLIAGALELVARQNRPAVIGERWFQEATTAAGAPGELRLVCDLAKLTETPHFRSYWVQRNVSALREFSSGAADLDRVRGEFRERRVLIRTLAAPAVTDESAAAQLIAMVPDDAGFYRAWLKPANAEAVIEQTFFSTSGSVTSERAPVVGSTGEAGSEGDLETRIDTTPLDRAVVPFKLSGRVDGMLEVSKSAAGDIFVGTRSAVVLAGDGLRLDAVDPAAALTIVSRGRFLIVGNSQDVVDAIVRKIGAAAAEGAAYVSVWRHGRELSNFERMTKLIDFPQVPAAEPGDAREPLFFSENLASFGRVMRRVQSVEVVVHDAGSMLRETVVYRVSQ
jgi:hypothetical protein